MDKRKILMPVRTVAEWGGVHEWTVDASAALLNRGHEVTFVGSGEIFKERAKKTGAKFISVDWESWTSSVREIAKSDRFDLIFSHAPQGRQLGLEINRLLGIEHIVMVHGAYHDFMYEWANQVDAFVAASPSLVHFTQRYGRVAPWKVSNLPNAAPDEIFNMPLMTFEDKVKDGVGHIVTASRLSRDKLPQLDATIEAATYLSKELPGIKWVIDVYGDGPMAETYRYRYERFCESQPNIAVKLHGWTEPRRIPEVMNSAFLTVTAGMAGVRACAAGSLCLGVGARNNVGIQYGQNLRAGIWSNFGDHGLPNFKSTSIKSDLTMMSDPSMYNDAIARAREVVFLNNRQTSVNETMFALLHC